MYRDGYRDAVAGRDPLYNDFISTYGAALLLRETEAEWLYLPQTMGEVSRRAALAQYGPLEEKQIRAAGIHPWHYPPTFLLLVAPLAALPYLAALVLWLAVTALPYLEAMRRIVPGTAGIALAVAAPPVFYNIMFGQTGFWVAGCLALGLVILRQQPLLAGCLIGLASVKPHFGLLVPLALIAGGQWRTLATASATVVATIGLSLHFWGSEPWLALFGTLPHALDGFSKGRYVLRHVVSPLGGMQMLGVAPATAWFVQSAISLSIMLLVLRVWWPCAREPERLPRAAAVLLAATTLVPPAAYIYDMPLVVPALALLWRDVCLRGGRLWERHAALILGLAWASVFPVGKLLSLPVGMLLNLTLLAWAVWRFYR